MILRLQSPAFVAILGCLLYLGTTLAFLSPAKLKVAARAVPTTAASTVSDEPSWKFQNPELDQWVEELRREKDSLNTREQQLRELQTRLDAERQEISGVTQTVHQLQADFDNNVVRFKDQEMDNLRRQAKVVSNMSPEGAAAMIMEMPDDDVVRLLFVMKADEASLILDTMSKQGKAEAKRAAAVAELMRHALPPAPAGPAAQTTSG